MLFRASNSTLFGVSHVFYVNTSVYSAGRLQYILHEKFCYEVKYFNKNVNIEHMRNGLVPKSLLIHANNYEGFFARPKVLTSIFLDIMNSTQLCNFIMLALFSKQSYRKIEWIKVGKGARGGG